MQRVHVIVRHIVSELTFINLSRRGGSGPRQPCPVEISDLVLLHNLLEEAHALSDKDLKQSSYNFWNSCPEMKDKWSQYFKCHKTRMDKMHPSFRVIRTPEEDSTIVKIPDLIVRWIPRKKFDDQERGEVALELQFVQHTKQHYLDLCAQLKECECSPKSKAGLQLFKKLILMDIAYLKGCDVAWQHPARDAETTSAPAVLQDGKASDDARQSDADGPAAPAVSRSPASRSAASR